MSGSANDGQRNRDDRTSEDGQVYVCDGQNGRHDPLCEYKEPDCECHSCFLDSRCDCDLIARVRADERAKAMAEDKWISAREAREYEADIRADERERAARVINRTCGHTKSVGAEACWHDLMVNAVRGESS